MYELPTPIADRIQALSASGDELAAEEEYEAAIAKYSEAWGLLPEPKSDWDASTWLLAAIGDACFLSQRFVEAHEAFALSMTCPGAIGNPFLHMRLGQCELELGNDQRAADELCRAYALEGVEIFAAQDPRYFEFLKTRIQPPASGVW